ncbi:MBL fold metallo-hydrolase [Alkaliphilus serpentinus]|uniref:MBL fold metallo-hydrolase n=1 Tax=Alkaliphilus serpentinus TaxID=1482731 RepID=A0A833HQB5_9FIRM|nr:MBL fold metallo-hydrolase [Alkaliphilus serpentinus]KAB3530731.1 MBL fold metallo-hydrolase [Alkaliphilus serpentinus]
MKLTVLGCYGPYPKAKGACSGYLLEDMDTKILIDCGNGVISKYFAHCGDLNILDAILISHLHPDHMSDLMVLRYAIAIGQMEGRVKKSIDLYLPSSPREEYERIPYKEAFNRHIIDDGMRIEIKGIKITFFRTNHPIECYGMIFDKGIKKFVYSGDTKYFPELNDYVKKCDLFLCEGGFLEANRKDDTPHLSALQAAEIAQKVSLKRLILTHIYPPVKVVNLYEEAREIFPNIIEIAEEGKTYYI